MAARRKPRPLGSRKGAATEKLDFPVVAIGASAGGLEAFRILLGALPAKSGMAFILVLHLDPDHASMIVELLSPHVAMTVVEASDAMPLEPDRVYVIPPGFYIELRDGALHLAPPPARPTVRMPLNYLLRSLAAEIGERAVCIILSGTATDGSIGATAIKESGGLVIAQDPDEAGYDGMPRSAIATGVVDLVLPLAMMPDALAKYGGHRYPGAKDDAALSVNGSFARIIDLLRERTSHDFALYKEATLGRRIERRMALSGIEDANRYLERLTRDSAELQRLGDDLLINVTRFFRGAKAFELLAQKVIPQIVRAHPPNQPIRVWVAGCSTGEEAYSITMLFLEEVAEAKRNLKLQVFATDVDADAIAVAREGLYPSTIEADLAPARLSRFFIKEDQGYRVSRELRAPIVFSVHDLMADAPFSRLDLISCRNLLIYLRPEAQEKVIAVFHYALRGGGVLFLGGAETVGIASDRFEPISKTQRIFRHVGRSRPGEVAAPLSRGDGARPPWSRPSRPGARPHTSISELAQRLLIETFAPASVLASQRHEGLYYSGPVDLYLKMPSGEANLDLMNSAREGLRPAIREAIEKATQRQEPVAVAGRVKRIDQSVAVKVRARPLTSNGQELVLLSFVDEPKETPKVDAEAGPAESGRIVRLEEELDATRKDLEGALRDREIAEEEIRAINEDAVSVNEEFQTTNEELETSHEELQSLNEELTALNSQLQETLEQNRATTDDMENILNSSDTATIFLDEHLNIRFFTPAAKALFSVITTDVGRPLADLAHHFGDQNLFDDARAVLSDLVPVTREIEAENAAWYNCRILPYRTKENRIEGVVITFADISARKHAEDVANAAKLSAENANLGKSRFLAAASHDLRQPLQTLSLLQGLLAKKVKDADSLQLLARSDAALAGMAGMLNTLLDINQLEAGVVRPKVVDFPINDLLEHLKTEFAYHAQAKGLRWRVLPCRLAIRSDPRLLDQMLRNLLSNALKYTERGTLLLGCRRHGGKLWIEVWDTGPGIPGGQLRSIFQEFHQIDNRARELSRGLGLGLAIVQRLGDLLGHAVDVRSREGRGSVFSIETPLAPRAARLAPGAIEREAEESAIRDGSILIVEDDPEVREALKLLVRAIGHHPTAAANGEEAIQIVEHESLRPDLVIVDYNLPNGLTGLQVMARLREVLDHGLPALVLTGDISTETLREIAAHGHVQRSKPVGADDLTRLIGRLLAGRKLAESPNRGSSLAEGDAGHGPIVFLVDDDHVVLESMRDLLSERGRRVEAYASAEAFLDAYRPGAEGCLLVDAVMPGMDGFALLTRLKDEGYSLPAIMITGHGDIPMAVQAMKAGAADFLQKPIRTDELVASIARALERERDSVKRSAWRKTAAERIAGLTPREREVMDLVVQGRPNKIIADSLGISQRTVENHRAAVMKRTGATTLPDLIRLVMAATDGQLTEV